MQLDVAVKKFFAVLVLSFAGSVSAQVAVDGMSLHGMAEYSELRKPFYIAALYSDIAAPTASELLEYEGRKRMEIRVSSRWTPRRFSTQWSQSILINGDQNLVTSMGDEFLDFNNLPKGMFRPGDQILIDAYPGEKTVISINGDQAISIANDQFFDLLLSAWIGNRPPSTEFKASIVSGGAPADLVERFVGLQADDSRKAITKGWYGAAASPAVVLAEPEANAQETPEQIAAAGAAQKAAEEEAQRLAAEEAEAAKIAAEEKILADKAAQETAAEQEKANQELYKLQQDTLLRVYKSSVVKKTLRNVKYPRRAVDRNQQGTVVIDALVNKDGKVISTTLKQEVKYKLLNKAALKALADTGKFPAMPAGLDAQSITISIPVKFMLQ